MQTIVCPNCGAKNRVDENRAQSQTPICGRCKQPLPIESTSSDPLILTDATIASTLSTAGEKPVLVDCWAPWCGPCRALAPTIEQLAAESNGRWVIAKLNTDENQQTAAQFEIDAIPCMLLFKNSKLIDRLVGLMPKQAIENRLATA